MDIQVILAIAGVAAMILIIVGAMIIGKYNDQVVGLCKYNPQTKKWGRHVDIVVSSRVFRQGEYAKRGYRIICRFYV